MAQKLAQFVINIFKFHKLKVFTALASSILFFVILFPFDDLGDMITQQISDATNNQVFITFEGMDLSLLPAPGVELEDVKLVTQQIQGIEAGQLSISPSILSLLAFKRGASISAKNLFQGNLDLDYSQGGKTEQGVVLENIEIEASDIELADLKGVINSPVNFKGKASLEGTASIDPTFEQQIIADLSLRTKELLVPAATVLIPNFGETPIPKFSFKSVDFKGKLEDGGLQIIQMDIGAPDDILSIRVKGQVGLTVRMLGGRAVPSFGAYNIRAQIIARPGLDSTITTLLNIFAEKYKKPGKAGDTYLFKAVGDRFGPPPRLSALQKFE